MSFKSLFAKRNPGAPLIVPLVAFYGRSRKEEAARARMYAHIAREFGSQGWKTTAREGVLKSKRAGRGGRAQDITKGTYKRPADHDIRASAAEFLQHGTILNDPAKILATDREKSLALGYGDIRRSAARLFVEYHEAITASALSSPDWMKEGHGTPGSMTPAEGRLYCAEVLSAIRRTMPVECAALADRVLLKDEHTWEAFEARPPEGMKPAARKAYLDEMLDRRNAALEDLRMAIDFIAYGMDMISLDRLKARWALARHHFILVAAVSRARREI